MRALHLLCCGTLTVHEQVCQSASIAYAEEPCKNCSVTFTVIPAAGHSLQTLCSAAIIQWGLPNGPSGLLSYALCTHYLLCCVLTVHGTQLMLI